MTAEGPAPAPPASRRRGAAALLGAAALASWLACAPGAAARVHWSVGIGIGVPAPYAWPYALPYYGPYSGPYYGGGYYTPWAPGWWPAPVVVSPPAVVQGVPWSPPDMPAPPRPMGPPPQSFWYYCSQPAGYYPQVANCPGGWTAVPVAPSAPAPGASSPR